MAEWYFLSEEEPPLLDVEELLNQIRVFYSTDAVHDDNVEKVVDLLEVARLQQEVLYLSLKEKEAFDFITADKLLDGSEAYLLDDVLNQPLSLSTLKNMLEKHKTYKNPFTGEEIKRIIKVIIKYE
jgi:hypothetical protein